MARGYDRPLYILPFDHRGSFQTKLFGLKSLLSAAQTAEIAGANQVIYDGFQAALADGVSRDGAGILVDEQFVAAFCAHCRRADRDRLPGREEWAGRIRLRKWREFARHIEAMDPTFCTVMTRYNPEGDRALNRAQAA